MARRDDDGSNVLTTLDILLGKVKRARKKGSGLYLSAPEFNLLLDSVNLLIDSIKAYRALNDLPPPEGRRPER